MAETNQTYDFKFIWLNDGDVAHNQSRGLSLQVNGFAPISLGPKNQGYFTQMLDQTVQAEDGTYISKICNWDLFEAINNNEDLTLLLKGVKYNVRKAVDAPHGQVAYTTDEKYLTYVYEFYNHMFTEIRANAANELSTICESGAYHKAITLEYDITSTMFGDKLKTSEGVYVDAIVFFGQAYNRLGRDETAQASLQNCVPIALLVYEDTREGSDAKNNRPLLITDLPKKVALRERICIGLEQDTEGPGSSVVEDPLFKEWNATDNAFHVVNDASTIGRRFFLNGNKVDVEDLEIKSYANEELLPEGTMMSNMRLNVNGLPANDWNQDFGSPAQFTVVCESKEGKKNPQTLITKAAYIYDADGNQTSGVWDGVAESYWQALGSQYNSGTSAVHSDVYSVDYISKYKPGLDFFSEDTLYAIDNPSFGSQNLHKNFNGANIFADKSFASYGGVNLSTKGVRNIGSNFVVNSQQTSLYAPGAKNNKNQYGSFVANGYNVYMDAVFATPIVSNAVINAANITIKSDGKIKALENLKRQRSVVLGSNSIAIDNSDNVNAIGVKGKTVAGKWQYSNISISKDTNVIGGYANIDNANACLVLGVKNTAIQGASINNPVKHSISMGIDNKLVATAASTQENIILVGKGLKNDVLQGIYDKGHAHTLILGENNNVYTQLKFAPNTSYYNYYDYYNTSIVPASIKQIVVGGYVPTGHGIEQQDWVKRYNCAELAVSNGDNYDTMWTLADVKGRTVDYTTRGVNIGVMPNKDQENFDRYNYLSLGSINWAKLYALLSCMYYDNLGLVHYDTARTPWNQTFVNYKHVIGGDTTLSKLVDCGYDSFPLPQ